MLRLNETKGRGGDSPALLRSVGLDTHRASAVNRAGRDVVGKLMRRLWTAAAVCLTLLASERASACSFSDEYVRPSDFELVQRADAIVVATPREGRRDGNLDRVLLDVGERVKGVAPPRVDAVGRLPAAPRKGEIIFGYSDEGHQGPCGGKTFRKGHRYLLFLERTEDGQLERISHAFSRADENYSAGAETWLRMVRRYVAIQAKAPPMEQIATLERMLKTGRDPSGARLTAEETQDLRDHLSSLSPDKPTPYLLAAYAALEQGKPPVHGDRAAGSTREPSGAEKAARLLLGQEVDEKRQGREEARRRLLVALVNGHHPDARPLFERLAAATPQDPSTAGLVLRYFAKNGDYPRTFAWIETRLMNLLPRLEPGEAKRLIGDVALAQGGAEGEERWRRDPHAAAAWPELALSLYWYQVRTFGADEAILFRDAFDALPQADMRARPLLTLALAKDYKEGVAKWAVAELRDAKKRQAWEGLPAEARATLEDPARLPLQILLSAWQAENGRVLEEVFCQSALRRSVLIRTLGDTGDSLFEWLVVGIGASDLSAEERDLLASAAARFAVREGRTLDADDVDKAVLVKALQRERIAGGPIMCRAATR
jgi:hypothetical protein